MKRDDLSQASHEELIDLVLASHERLQDVEQQLRWFKKQLFGAKSERRLVEEPSSQLSLGENIRETGGATEDTAPKTPVRSHQRRPRQPREEADDSGLR